MRREPMTPMPSRRPTAVPPSSMLPLLLAAGLVPGCVPAWKLEWSEGASLPEPLAGQGFAVIQGAGFLIGGQGVENGKPAVLQTVRLYDVSTGGGGDPVPPLPRRVRFAGVVGHADTIVVVGGDDGEIAAVDVVRLEAGEDGKPAWRPLAKLPEPRTGAAVAVDRDSVYVIGGGTSVAGPGSETNEVLRYDFDRPAAGWVPTGTLPGAGRRHAASTSIDGRIHIFGGVHEDDSGRRLALRDTWRYFAERDEWIRTADLPEPLWGASAVAVGRRYVLIVGGAGQGHLDAARDGKPFPPHIRRVWLYDIVTDLYRPLMQPPATTLHPATAVFGNSLYLLGGVGTDGKPEVTVRRADWDRDGIRWYR